MQCEYCWDKECSRMGEDEQGSRRGVDGGCRRVPQARDLKRGTVGGASSSELWCSECLVRCGNMRLTSVGSFETYHRG